MEFLEVFIEELIWNGIESSIIPLYLKVLFKFNY